MTMFGTIGSNTATTIVSNPEKLHQARTIDTIWNCEHRICTKSLSISNVMDISRMISRRRQRLVVFLLIFVTVLVPPVAVESVRITPNDFYRRLQKAEHNRLKELQLKHDNVSIPLLRDYNFTPTSTQQQSQQQQEEERRDQSASFTVDVPTSPDDHLVTELPLLDPSEFTTRHWAGHLPANDVVGDKYLFYWLFEPDLTSPRKDDSNPTDPNDGQIPILVWLNGGPACSSMDGLWLENGPFRIVIDANTNNYKIVADPYSWHKLPAYTLYIDQPVGTGLSITSSRQYPTNDNEVNVDLYYFFQQFLKLHSDKFLTGNKLNRGLFFSGESYAGHYIPSFINYLLKQNKDLSNDSIEIPISGAAIGNGWTDPFYQYSAAEFALGQALIDIEQYNYLKQQEVQCQDQLNQGNYNVGVCFDLVDNIVNNARGAHSIYKVLSYDIRQATLRDEDRQFPFGHKVLETYLGGWKLDQRYDKGTMTSNFKDVLKAIHASAMEQTDYSFTECTDPPYNALSGNDGLGVVDDVVDILNTNAVRLLFFNGVYDIVCNHIGNERFLNNLKTWPGVDGFRKAERYAWYSHDTMKTGSKEISGFMKKYQNLQFLKINNAGHMVPVDVPEVAFDMMYNFIRYEDFQQRFEQKLDVSLTNPDEKSCPVCPTCQIRDSGIDNDAAENDGQKTTTTDYNSSNTSGAMGTFVISYAWIVAGVALVSFFTFVGVSRRNGNVRRRADHIPISSTNPINDSTNGNVEDLDNNYNIELRIQGHTPSSSATSPYRDDKNDDYDEDDGDATPYMYPPTQTTRRYEIS